MGLTPDSSAAAVPRHLAIIMDGNGRWASARSLPRVAGHRAGQKAVRQVIESSRRLGIRTLTLFAFSSENWQRPKGEVSLLMDLFLRSIRRELAELKRNGVCLHFIGSRRRFSPTLRQEMLNAERDTAANDDLHLVVAVDYGGRWDLAQAAQEMARACVNGDMKPEAIDEAQLARHMSLSGHDAPDLFIRTGGERRLSNFLLWDLAYSELYFTDTLWPDFNAETLQQALQWYASRERRFGRIAPSDERD